MLICFLSNVIKFVVNYMIIVVPMKYPLILTLLLSTTKKEINNHKCLSPINVLSG